MLIAWKRRTFCLVILAGVLPGLAAGCGGSGDDASQKYISRLVPVTGTVKYDGKPLSGVLVTYLIDPDTQSGNGELASGLTDETGKYKLATLVPGKTSQAAEGAIPASYKVTITQLVMPDQSPIPAETTDADAEAMGAKQLLPAKYSSLTATKLTAVVKSEPTVNDFDLKK